MGHYPLQNIKVIDLSGYIAGAYGLELLADLGASVIKVESPSGDAFRYMMGGFPAWNRGKQSVVLNLAHVDGRRILYRMIEEADVIAENYRAGVAEKLGVDYDTVKRINSRIIYCSVKGYGAKGPLSDKPAFDPIMQALSGVMKAQGGDGESPVFLSVATADYGGALFAAFGIALAIFHRARTGEGQRVDSCLLNACMAVQAGEFFFYSGKPVTPRVDSLGINSTYRLYQAKDGWLFLSCSDDDSWGLFCDVIGRGDLRCKFKTAEMRKECDHELRYILEDVFVKKKVDQWISILGKHQIKCGPVRTVEQFHNEPQALHNGLIVEGYSPDLGHISQIGQLVKFSKTPGRVGGSTPSIGQDTDIVLSDLGYSPEQIESFRGMGIVG